MGKKKLATKKSQIPHCSWCRASLQNGRTTWYILMKSKFDLHPKGKCVEMKFPFGETILAYIIGENSPARKDGWEMAFLACSQNCLDKLHATFKESKRVLLQSSLS